MIPILDWIFEGIVNWVASVVSQLFDAVSGLFLESLGTDMTAMEEYFPFVTKAYDVMQVTAWAILILITIWQLFRAFGGPITEAENPWHLLVRSSVYGLLIGYAKPIFSLCLNIARAPYTTLMELSMTAEDFTLHVMTDDAPLRCRHYYCSAAGSTERTEVYVVPEQDFMRWYEAEKNFPDEGVKLHAQTTFWQEKAIPKQG